MARGTPRGRDMNSWSSGSRGRSPTRRGRSPRKPKSYRVLIENLSTRVTTGVSIRLFSTNSQLNSVNLKEFQRIIAHFDRLRTLLSGFRILEINRVVLLDGFGYTVILLTVAF